MLNYHPINRHEIIRDNPIARGVIVLCKANLKAIVTDLNHGLRIMPLEFRNPFTREDFTHGREEVKGFGMFHSSGNGFSQKFKGETTFGTDRFVIDIFRITRWAFYKSGLARGLGNGFLCHGEIIA